MTIKPINRHWHIKLLCAELREIRHGIRKAQEELDTKKLLPLIRQKIEKRQALREAVTS